MLTIYRKPHPFLIIYICLSFISFTFELFEIEILKKKVY